MTPNSTSDQERAEGVGQAGDQLHCDGEHQKARQNSSVISHVSRLVIRLRGQFLLESSTARKLLSHTTGHILDRLSDLSILPLATHFSSAWTVELASQVLLLLRSSLWASCFIVEGS